VCRISHGKSAGQGVALCGEISGTQPAKRAKRGKTKLTQIAADLLSNDLSGSDIEKATMRTVSVAEAGFFPGIIFYLTLWYPAKYRARVMSTFILGIPLSAVLGGPISGFLLELNNVSGLKGWQWLFILEGLPAVLLGIVAFFYLTDRPANAAWLAPEQKVWLTTKLVRESAAKEEANSMAWPQALVSPKVLALGVIYFGLVMSLSGIQFWLPQIVKAFGLTNIETGFVSALPFAFGTVAMFLWGRRSDREKERVLHIALPLFLTAVALAASTYADNLTLTMVALSLAAIGEFAAFGLFWTLPTAWLNGAAAAAAIGLINCFGSLAGFAGSYLIGWVKESTGSTIVGLLALAVFPLVAGLLVLFLGHDSKGEFAAEERMG
jgi:MFS transporter, ACS family, tartrate transporter